MLVDDVCRGGGRMEKDMNKVQKSIMICLLGMCMSVFVCTVCSATEIYVSPNGTPDGEGTIDSPIDINSLSERTERGNFDVIFREGEYTLQSKISRPLGVYYGNITYKNYNNEKVVIKGTKQVDISEFKDAGNTEACRGLKKSVRNKIKVLDLNKIGLYREQICVSGTDRPNEIFYLNGNKQPIAQYPNDGYETVKTLFEEGGSHTKFIFEDTQRASKWINETNAYIKGYFEVDWYGEWINLDSVEITDYAVINLSDKTSYSEGDQIPQNAKWKIVNSLYEIDMPGEWYIDIDNMLFYYYPQKELSSTDKFEIAVLNEPFFEFYRAEGNINDNTALVQGIEMAYSNAPAVQSVYTGRVSVKNCRIHDVEIGISLSSPYASEINSNEIYSIGHEGIYLSTGRYINQHAVVSDNIISDVGLNDLTNFTAGIRINGTKGVEIKNNTIHNTPNAAIRYSGADISIKYNELYNNSNDTYDSGVIYAYESLLEYGTEIMYNYIYNFGSRLVNINEDTINGIYLDGSHSGNTVKYNIVAAGNKYLTNGTGMNTGRDNIFCSNIFVGMKRGVALADWSGSKDIRNSYLYTDLLAYLEKYPNTPTTDKAGFISPIEIKEIIDTDNGIFRPYNSCGKNNLIYDCIEKEKIYGSSDVITFENNINADSADVFVDAQNGDFRVRTEINETYNLDVLDETFDFNSIGIITDNITYGDFSLSEPERVNVDYRENLYLSWEKAVNADKYICQVATDSDFNNIIFNKETEYSCVNFTEGEKGKKYYWRVIAENESFKNGNSWYSNEIGIIYYKNNDIFIENVTAYKSDIPVWDISDFNGDMQVSIEYENLSEKSLISEIIIAAYSEYGKLCKVINADIELKQEKNIHTGLCVFDNIENISEVRVYAWEKNSMIPLDETYELF